MPISSKIYVHNLIWFIIYFLIAASIGMLARDIPGQPLLFANIENFMTPAEVTKLGDPKSFAAGALDIYHHGWISQENQWLIHLWPPGFMVITGLIIKVFGLHCPFIFILILLNSFFVAVLLTLLRANLLIMISPVVAALLPCLPFLFPVTRLFLLEPGGIILGEAFSIVFFLIALQVAPIAIRQHSFIWAIYAGVMLALSAYFRPQFEIIILFFTFTTIILAGTYWLVLKTRISIHRHSHLMATIKIATIILITAHLTMLPWRIHNLHDPTIRTTTTWVATPTLVYQVAGLTDAELMANGGGFLIDGGGNITCNLESSYCGKSNRNQFYKAFLYHPIAWTIYKLKILPKYWFSSLKNYTSTTIPATNNDIIINSIILFVAILNLALLLKLRHHPEITFYASQYLTFYACNLAILLFNHLETRYFYAMKIYCLFMFIPIFGLAWKLIQAKTHNLRNEFPQLKYE